MHALTFQQAFIFVLAGSALFFITACQRKPQETSETKNNVSPSDERQWVVRPSKEMPRFSKRCEEESGLSQSHISELLNSFTGMSVQRYIIEIAGPENNFTGRVFSPPDEYQNVVKEGKPLVPCLLELLEEKEAVFRLAALFALVEITNERFGSPKDFAVETSPNVTGREETIAQWKAWWQSNKNRSRVEWLIEDLDSSDRQKKNYAATQLGKLGDKSAIPPLRKLLEEDGHNFYATKSLAELGDSAAIPYLVELYLRHDMYEYRKEGIEMLRHLTGKTFGFDPNGSEEARLASIKNWEAWWNQVHKN